MGALSTSLAAAAGLGWLCLDSWRAVGREPSPSFDHLLAATAATGACLVVAWCALVAVLVVLTSLPGRLGAAAATVARGVAPAAARRRARAVLGLTIAAAQLGLAVSSASATGDLPPIGRPPVDPPTVVVPPDERPTPVEPPAPVPVPAGTPDDGLPDERARVAVRPGDTLWAITADHLGHDATPADVARSWPAWFAANREVIGPDPDLIRPGTVLVEPAPPTDPE